MSVCNICPRACRASREKGSGFCGKSDVLEISRAAPHYWEEPCISGKNGSGTVFFTGCNLGCVFCQNYLISRRSAEGKTVSGEELERIFLDLRDRGVHNINLVTPTHYTEALIPVLERVKPRLGIPVVWNSSGYELADELKKLEGLVDIYLPDIKFYSSALSQRLCGAEDYFERAVAAVDEMLRQQPSNVYGEDGLLKKGVIIRQLVLPSHTLDSIHILEELAERFGTDISVSLMCQYIPEGKAADFSEINRRLKRREYARVTEAAERLGFVNGYTQDFASADESFIPEFSLKRKEEDEK